MDAVTLWSSLDKIGVLQSHTTSSVAYIRKYAEDWVSWLLGRDVAAVRMDDICPRLGGRNFVNSDVDGVYHTDGHPFAPAHLQVLVCVEAANLGGENLFVDSWALLKEAKANDPQLFDALFTHVRAMRIMPDGWFGPTFSVRSNNLIFVHPPKPMDSIGARVHRWIQDQAPVIFNLSPGDFLVANNHRLAHSRTKFVGRRHMLRILVWLKEPLAAPAEYKSKAEIFSKLLESKMESFPLIVQRRFGIFQTRASGNDERAQPRPPPSYEDLLPLFARVFGDNGRL